MTPSTQPDDYARGWAELMRLVREGYSWSGEERNRFFLNGRSGRYHEMSALAGLDQADDGRGLALVDWDQDGRLDLWYRNRSAPRLRVMLNRREMGPSVAIRLEGVRANRDGIGAVVEVLPAVEGSRTVKSVRAGDLFLSQSSKWLHFGLGDREKIESVEVLWPGGERERFAGVTTGGRFVLKEGAGEARPWEAGVKRSTLVLTGSEEPLKGLGDDGHARILLPTRMPLPQITYRDKLARATAVQPDGKPRLVVLWSGTCGHCERQLQGIADAAPQLRAARLNVLALSVEGAGSLVADSSSAYDLMDRLEFPFDWGLIDGPSVEFLHWLQSALFDRTPAAAVPLALLVDERMNIVAIYRGPFLLEEVLEDWQLIRGADEKALYHLAPPLTGTWFTNPLKQADVIRLIREHGVE